MDLGQTFADGGAWMWLVLVLGLCHWATLAYQLARPTSANLIPFLWGVLASTVLLGVLGSVVGLHFGIVHVAGLEPAEFARTLLRVAPIALTTTILALVFAVPGALMTGVAATLQQRRRAG